MCIEPPINVANLSTISVLKYVGYIIAMPLLVVQFSFSILVNCFDTLEGHNKTSTACIHTNYAFHFEATHLISVQVNA